MLLKQSTPVVISFGPFEDKTDGVTHETGLVSALDHASTGIMLSKNGAAFAVRHATVTASVYDAHGCYRVTLDTTDTNTLGSLRVIYSDPATCLPVWQDFEVVTANVYDSLIGGTDVLRVRDWTMIRTGTAQAGASGTITLDAGASSTDDFYPTGTWRAIVSGTGAGQIRRANGYVGATKVLTVAPAWKVIPDDTSVFALMGADVAAVVEAAGLAGSACTATFSTVIENAVLDAAMSSHVAAGSIGLGIGHADAVEGRLTATRAGYLDKLNITGNVASTGEVDAVKTDTGAIKTKVDTLHDTRIPGVIQPQTGDAFARLGAPAGASVSADVAAVKGDTAAVKAKTDNLPTDPADQSLVIAATDAVMARLGAPVGASVSADVAAVKADTGATKTKVDTLHDTRIPGVIQPQTGDGYARLASYRLGEVLSEEKSGAPTAGSFLGDLTEDDGGTQRFTANALEQAPSGGAGTTPQVLLDTTIATVSSQTVFTLTAGPADNDAFVSQTAVFYDASSGDDPSVRKVLDYVASTKEITIDAAPDFTVIAGDGIKIFVAAAGATAPTAGEVADEVLDQLANEKIVVDRDAGQITAYEADGVTPRGVRTLTDIDANIVGLVPV